MSAGARGCRTGGSLSDEEIWDALAYIKKQWSRKVRSVRAEMLRNTESR